MLFLLAGRLSGKQAGLYWPAFFVSVLCHIELNMTRTI